MRTRTGGNLFINVLFAFFALWMIGSGLYLAITNGVQTDEGRKKKKKRENASDISSCCDYVTFDGHEYVRYIEYNRGGIAHSPKCHCMTNNVAEIK